MSEYLQEDIKGDVKNIGPKVVTAHRLTVIHYVNGEMCTIPYKSEFDDAFMADDMFAHMIAFLTDSIKEEEPEAAVTIESRVTDASMVVTVLVDGGKRFDVQFDPNWRIK